MSMLAVVFVAIHVLTSVLDTFVHIGWLAIVVPFTSSYEQILGRRRDRLARPACSPSSCPACCEPRMQPGHLAGPALVGLPSPGRSRWPTPSAWGPTPGSTGCIALGVVCVPPSRVALVWRLRRRGPPDRRSARPRVRADVPPTHLALSHTTGRSRRHDPSAQRGARPGGRSIACSASPTDLAGHLATLGPLAVAAPVTARRGRTPWPEPSRTSGSGRPGWRRLSRRPSSSRWPEPPAPAARSWSTAWRASRPATRTSCC